MIQATEYLCGDRRRADLCAIGNRAVAEAREPRQSTLASGRTSLKDPS